MSQFPDTVIIVSPDDILEEMKRREAEVKDYRYTGTAPMQIGNDQTLPYTAHDDIKLTDGPLY